MNGIAPGADAAVDRTERGEFRSDACATTRSAAGLRPSDVIDAIRYLIKARCVTGQVLVIDSGQRFMALERDVQFLGEQ